MIDWALKAGFENGIVEVCMDMLMTIGKTFEMVKYRTRLKALREQHGKTRMDIVRDCEFAYPTVVNWETRALKSLDAAKVKTLMVYFDCSYEDLVYIEGDKATS